MLINVVGERVVCPQCQEEVQLLRISRAAKLVDVSRRTIYSYIEEGSVYAARVAGKTMRVCPGCLLQAQGSTIRREPRAGERSRTRSFAGK